ncbi:MAG: hypothetical protein ACI8XO_001972 [Verrucomicrobiales bacterium]
MFSAIFDSARALQAEATLGAVRGELPELFRAEASAKIGSSQKSVIMIYLPGGLPHQDMYDIKVDTPSPGIQVWELQG